MDDCLRHPHFWKPPIWTTGFSWFRHDMTKLSMVPLRLMPFTLCFRLSERAMSDHVDIEVAKLCTNLEGNRSIHRLSRYQPYQPSSSIPSRTRSHGDGRCAICFDDLSQLFEADFWGGFPARLDCRRDFLHSIPPKKKLDIMVLNPLMIISYHFPVLSDCCSLSNPLNPQ